MENIKNKFKNEIQCNACKGLGTRVGLYGKNTKCQECNGTGIVAYTK